MIISFSKKNRIILYVFAGLLLLIFTLSLSFFWVNNNKKRFVYTFPSADENKYVLESRYFVRYNKNITDLSEKEYYMNKYIEELLLGSTLERTKLLFKRGTKVNSCFISNDVLYIDLSKDMLQYDNECTDIKEGVNLLYKNVHNNFSKIKSIELFVDGKYAYEKQTSN